MFTEDKVTEIFCMADDFCKFYDAMMDKYTILAPQKRRYHRDGTFSKAEVMMIMILFHNSGYRCLKHFYLEHVCKRLRHLFPEVVSYNGFLQPLCGAGKRSGSSTGPVHQKGAAWQMYRYQLC